MKSRKRPYIASQQLNTKQKEVKGKFTRFDGEPVYCIENYDYMNPFFMSITSSSDLWMFISSGGSLTAGRHNFNNALFPYYTDDKINESAELTGPKTIIRILTGQKMIIWEPFSNYYRGLCDISRNLYKNRAGNKIIFQEINNDLEISFSYCWMSSDQLGWVRKSTLENKSGKNLEIEIVDGLQNVLPYGITRETQSLMSTLMDAYKVSELLPGTNLALFRMSSIPVDRPEPSEALRTNTIWSCGLQAQRILLSSRQLNNFRFGDNVETEQKVFGVKTSYFLYGKFLLAPSVEKDWYIVADVARDSKEITALQNLIIRQPKMPSYIESSVGEDAKKLEKLVSLADGIQVTGDTLSDRRHYANVMFNIMRGGIFESDYDIDLVDFLKHLEQSSKSVYSKYRDTYPDTDLPARIEDLQSVARNSNDKDLIRLTYEYLPLSFSRRHGDPSRPWNYFDISVRNPDGSPSLNYQGNWRDIFQNWEALAFSFPGFLPNMVSRFLNASTADGYNPYRITSKGFDWEVPDPENPWAHIGYWGDHQIIYLLKLLELFEKFYPGQIFEKFKDPIFVYANVPYRIKEYKDIIENPQDTIIFDRDLHGEIIERSRKIGVDGMLKYLANGQILRAGFIEKILVSLLTRLSNFVPEAGIWLNTQRPEWNDANNALVGNGASMVTLYHLQRFVSFFIKITANQKKTDFVISAEVISFYKDISLIFKEFRKYLHEGFSDQVRKDMADKLGVAGSEYRAKVYKGFDGKKQILRGDELKDFFRLVTACLDHSINANKRDDGLYHSYNLLGFSDKSVSVQHLQLMLEGQAAILSSGRLNEEETGDLMKALFSSNLWREDQQSFMLYPLKDLPDFLEKNIIPAGLVKRSMVLQKLLSMGNINIINQDENGRYHFNSGLRNAGVLKDVLEKLPPQIDKELLEAEHELICEIYESVFKHRYFTGRSGSFYKYEGIGSIYWHMVSKLLLALGENIMRFASTSHRKSDLSELIKYYRRTKSGIGIHKTPGEYGAFPTDPYSHTPLMMGAQQPGLTGQVKEDILSRFNELGLLIDKGEIKILPVLLQEDDFINGINSELGFTFCNTSFVFRKGEDRYIIVYWTDKGVQPLKLFSGSIPGYISEHIFNRSGKILQIVAFI
jgi:hypothetical protein